MFGIWTVVILVIGFAFIHAMNNAGKNNNTDSTDFDDEHR